MEPNKPKQGSLMSAFRKVAFVVLAGAALTGGAVEANAQSNNGYNNGGVTYTTVVDQQQQQKPWANNPSYQSQVQNMERQAALAMQQLEERAKADLARLQATRTQQLNAHVQRMSALKNKRNVGPLDYAALANSYAAQEAAHKSRVIQVQSRVEENRIRQEQTLDKNIERLDSQFARQEPYKSMLQQQQQGGQTGVTSTSTTRPAAVTNARATVDPDQKMIEDMEKKRREVIMRNYSKYADEEAKAGRAPIGPEEYIKKLEESQRRSAPQTAKPGV